jgi:calcium-dependent protein kinase
LKPENVLFESDKPGALLKVVDFGTSANFTEGEVLKQ